MKKVLLTATVQSHIAQFHLPLIHMLKLNGYEVHVAGRNNLKEKNGLKIEGPDKIFDIPFERSPLSKNNIKAYKQLKRILINNSYDIVHCNTPMGGVITRLAANEFRKKGTKVYYTAHGFHFYKGSPLKNWLVYYPIEMFLARYTDKLITITKEDYELASKKFKTNIYHVHGVGVNTSKYNPVNKEEKDNIRMNLGFKKNEFIIICIGELNKNKNQKAIINAMPELIKRIPNVKLLLAGNGPNEADLKHLVSDLKVIDNVKFLGYRTDLNKYINLSDLVVSFSYREGLPLNIMEAMICKKPIVASKNRGHKELINDKVSGILVNPNNHRDIEKTVSTLYLNKGKQRNLAEMAFNLVKPYTIENVLEEIKEIYF
ncbi:glycosyltransferase family 4 protein [Bacillus sp. UNC438CL73TsuS30]|uniref:glycosyltransferase family 4 protein n=1 Tax=Bacillus sp. UNC438CL73TsuS30 TaxID=1340434 RepID=UPI000555151E|nr:glycosyltransferase family 4 protein [Bacillus sp. UNC438CL73TsuS30]